MGTMATRAHRSQRVALTHARGMEASLVLLECIFMALAACRSPLDGILAQALDVVLRRRMVLEVDVSVTAGTSDRLVDRLRKGFPLNVQGERFPVRKILLEPL